MLLKLLFVTNLQHFASPSARRNAADPYGRPASEMLQPLQGLTIAGLFFQSKRNQQLAFAQCPTKL